jgi:hypothetical protein
LCGGTGALDMGVPQRERIGIARRHRERVDDRGRRAVAQPAAVVEPPVGNRGHTHKDEGNGGRQGDDGEGEHPRRAAERRQPEPQSEPGDGQEQAGGGREWALEIILTQNRGVPRTATARTLMSRDR